MSAVEGAHAPSGAERWCEAWHLDAATQDGVGLTVLLATWPARGVAWWWTYLVQPDLPGPVVVRDHEVPLPRQGLEIRADSLWGQLSCETPMEHWTYGLEAFGVRLDDPADALRGEIGERLPIGLDIEWEVDAAMPAHERPGDWPRRGYAQLGTVHGELLLGRSRYELDAVGRRSHTWGDAQFDRPAHAAWMRAPELSVSFAVVDGRTDGQVVRGHQAGTIEHVHSETRRASGMPIAARHIVDDVLELDVEVLGLAPVPVGEPGGASAVLARALCRYDLGGGDTGVGWSSWLDPSEDDGRVGEPRVGE